MREMKDSGIEWVGEIPANWKVVYPKQLFHPRKERARVDDVMLTASQHLGMVPQNEFMEKESYTPVAVEKGHDILKHVEPGDFVISMRSFQGGLEYSRVRGKMSSAYLALECHSSEVEREYYRWLFKSPRYIQCLQSTTNLVRDGQALRFANFIQVYLPVPPKDEQLMIANYLEEKCAEIDAAIAAAEASIEEYELYRRSVIFQAVTKGLDDFVEMKDSGIEWIGKVPTTWEVCRFKHCYCQVSESGHEDEELLSVYLNRGVIRYTDSDGTQVHKPSVTLEKYQLVRPGNLVLNNQQAWRGSVGVSFYRGIISPAYHIFETTGARKLDFEYANLLFRYALVPAFDMCSRGVGSIQKCISIPEFNNSAKILIPPAAEQKIISEYVASQNKVIDEIVATKLGVIEELKSYKKSLIYEVVTGKREVH